MANISFPQKSKFDTLTANKILCPILDTSSGVLALKSGGASVAELSTIAVFIQRQLKLGTTRAIIDASDTVIIATDDLGHINELARIDAIVESGAESETVWITPSQLTPSTQSGTIGESNGQWLSEASDILYMFFSGIIPFKRLKGTVQLEKVKVFFSTFANDDYITLCDIWEHNLATEGTSQIWDDPTDKGNGSSGPDNTEYTLNLTLGEDKHYSLRIQTIIGTTSVSIQGIRLKFRTIP